MKKVFLCLLIGLMSSTSFATKPDPTLTPGELCTPSNKDFAGYRYAAHIAYCTRDVTDAMKLQIAQAYGGIPQSDWPKYEFDHLIPLNAGGDSSIANLWPQPLAQAKEKDKIEQQVYDGLNNGTLTQAQAVQMIWDWVDQQPSLTDNLFKPSVAAFKQVTPDIYRGGRPTSADLASMQSQYKIAMDIDLENDTSVSDKEQASAEKIKMQFSLTAMNAYATPTDAEVNGVLAQLQDSRNFPIYLHCHYGEDRTGLLIGLYRVEVQKWTPAQAYQEMLADGFHPALTGLANYFRKRTGYTGN